MTTGALAAHQPLAVIGVHLQHQLPAGTVGAAAGTVNASSDEFEITVTGRGGHAGYPHLAVNPVPALCAAVVALQQVTSRYADPTHAVVASVGAIEGGRAHNVIPETARALGSLRALDPADRPRLQEAVRGDRHQHLPGVRLRRPGHHHRGRARAGQRPGAGRRELAVGPPRRASPSTTTSARAAQTTSLIT